jgi:hypothetical protein
MAAFYASVDGMAQLDDETMIRLWPFDEVRPIASAYPEYADISDCAPNCFLFADYLIWSWAYAIVLSADADASTPVLLLDTAPVSIADSWTHFLELCLANDPRLSGNLR